MLSAVDSEVVYALTIHYKPTDIKRKEVLNAIAAGSKSQDHHHDVKGLRFDL